MSKPKNNIKSKNLKIKNKVQLIITETLDKFVQSKWKMCFQFKMQRIYGNLQGFLQDLFYVLHWEYLEQSEGQKKSTPKQN